MRFGILTTKGHFNFDDICFGRLCRLPMSTNSSYGSFFTRMTVEDIERATVLTNLNGSDFVAVDFPLDINISQWRDMTGIDGHEAMIDHACKEIVGVLESLKMYEGMWVYQEEYRTLRVFCDKPYDQVATLLFLARNLSMKMNIKMFAKLRELGYSPVTAALVAHLFNLEGTVGRFGGGEFKVCTMTTDEYNWVNPQTFTKSDFIKLLKQEEMPEWFGGIWNASEYGGYLRDHQFEEMDKKFREDLVNTEDTYDDDDFDDGFNPDSGNNGPYYKLVDVFSSVDAEFTPPFPFQDNHADGGFIIEDNNRLPLETLTDALDALLLEAGIAK